MGTLAGGCDMRTLTVVAPFLLVLIGIARGFPNFPSHSDGGRSLQNRIKLASKDLGVPEWRMWDIWFQLRSSMLMGLPEEKAQSHPLLGPIEEQIEEEADINSPGEPRERRDDMRMIRLRKSMPVMRLRRSGLRSLRLKRSVDSLQDGKMKVLRL